VISLPDPHLEQVEDRLPISNAALTFSPMTRTMPAISISLFIIISSHYFSHHSLCHLFIQSYLAFQTFIMPLPSDSNVQGWFEGQGLPWTDVIATQLLHDGYFFINNTM